MVQHHTAPSAEGAPHADAASGSTLRVCVALFRWSGTELETATGTTGHIPWAAPAPEEELGATAERIIREWAGVDAEYVEQLYTFSRSDAQQREIVISYLGLFSPETFAKGHSNDLSWTRATATQGVDEIEHMVLEYALVRLRAKLGYTNIAFHLVPSSFTLPELQHVYESILGQPMDKRNFRRRMIASGILEKTDETRRDGSHRPAMLYRFSEQEDHTSYLTPPWQSGS